MGRIQSSIGLITGLDIGSTVDQLIKLQSVPRDNLSKQIQTRDQQQLALSGLATQLIGLQLAVKKLNVTTLYDQRAVASSNADILSATLSGKPELGAYQFTSIQVAQAQRQLSSGVASRTAALGQGKVSFRFGGYVDGDTSLDLFNSGAGVRRGKIRITDRSGASSEIDLRFARTAEDVVRAINENPTVAIEARLRDDRLELVDLSGSTTSSLKVDEVGGGNTAADLGLAGINTPASSVVGSRVVQLFGGLALDQLNDGRGVRSDDLLDDLSITLRDGSTVKVDFSRVGTSTSAISAVTGSEERPNSRLKLHAVEARQELVGVQVKFVDDSQVTRGSETVQYDANAGTLTFRIDQGRSTAADVLSALKRNSTVSKLFGGALADGSKGTDLALVADAATFDGPRSTAITGGATGGNAKLAITAARSSTALDGYQLIFHDNAAIVAGNEAVAVDDQAKTITVEIDEGSTTANQVVTALTANTAFAANFTANVGSSIGSNGTGYVSSSDGATTAGARVITPRTERTIDELLATINEAGAGRLSAAIAADGKRIELTDLSADLGGTFAVAQLNGSRVAEDLGLLGTAQAATISGRRVLSGLGTTLLSSLDGGSGIGGLGLLTISNRAGGASLVDLSGAETLADVVRGINDTALGVVAEINDARDGIQLRDTTGATANHLIVANGDATNTADQLGLAIDAAVDRVNGGSLHKQVVGENTKLAALNGGAGVAKGSFTLFDTNGQSRTFNVGTEAVSTVGDLLREINGAGIGVSARINDAGDGILLVDTALGDSALHVTEGSSTSAADLRLLGDATTLDIGGEPRKVINAATTFSVDLDANDSLDDLATKLNALGAGVSFSVINDGSAIHPFRLSVVSQRSGRAGEVLVDASQVGLDFTETARAQDALLALGSIDAQQGATLVGSADNVFRDVLPGVTLQVRAASTSVATVSVTRTQSSLTDGVKDVIGRYNTIIGKVRELTNRSNPTKGILASSSALLRLQNDLAGVVGARYSGTGTLAALASVGITFFTPAASEQGISADDANQLGDLEFDADKLQAAFDANPNAIQQLFGTKDSGFSARLSAVIDQLAGTDNALLLSQITSINRQIEDDNRRLAIYNTQLDNSRRRLTDHFNQAEIAIAKIRDSANALASLASISGVTSNSTTNG